MDPASSYCIGSLFVNGPGGSTSAIPLVTLCSAPSEFG